jgi:dihydrofolate synthase/folylpolyglutamate synthase
VERFLGIRATWFELVTAAAYAWFADMAAESVVAEVGLGGRFDATNAGDGDVAVVTNVELDHTQILGDTREEIAGEKAGIIKPDSLLVLGERDPSISAIFESEAERVGARAIWRRDEEFGCASNQLAIGGRLLDLWTPLGRFSDVFVPLHGVHQGDNAACAVAAAQAFLGRTLEADIVMDAFAALKVPGRLEVVRRRPLVVLDGAHNPAGAATVGEALREDFAAARRVVMVFVVMTPCSCCPRSDQRASTQLWLVSLPLRGPKIPVSSSWRQSRWGSWLRNPVRLWKPSKELSSLQASRTWCSSLARCT